MRVKSDTAKKISVLQVEFQAKCDDNEKLKKRCVHVDFHCFENVENLPFVFLSLFVFFSRAPLYRFSNCRLSEVLERNRQLKEEKQAVELAYSQEVVQRTCNPPFRYTVHMIPFVQAAECEFAHIFTNAHSSSHINRSH